MKSKLLICLALAVNMHGFAQDSVKVKKPNPIVFVESFLGYGGAFNEFTGFMMGGSVNFQHKNHLFTVRGTSNPEFKYVPIVLGPASAFPGFESRRRNIEIALLYGRRYIKEGRSWSFSGGFSGNEYLQKLRDPDGNISREFSNHYGFAYEASIKWFKKEKRPYHVYLVVPVGKPVSFGHSFGFKLVGNISKHSYLGIGMT